MAVATTDPNPVPKTVIPLTPGTTVHAPTAHIKVSAPKAVAPVREPAAPRDTGALKLKTPDLKQTLNAVAPGGTSSPQQFAAQQTAKSQSTLNQYLNYLGTNLGRVPAINYGAIGSQANNELEGMVSPLLQGYNQQLASGTQAINQYTGQLSTQLGNIGTQIGGIYNQAEQQQSALDTAIQAELAGNGGQQAAALQTALQNAGQDTAPAAQAAANATGAAGAQYAEGSASLASLFGQGAAAQAYGATLPGIAKLSGLQALGNLQGTIGTAETKAIDTAESKYPTLVNQLTNTAVKEQSNQLAASKVTATQNVAKLGLVLGSSGSYDKSGNLTPAAQREVNALGYGGLVTGAPIKDVQAAARLVTANKSLQARITQNSIADALRTRQITDSEAKQAQSYQVQLDHLGIQDKSLALRLIQAQKTAASGGLTGGEWATLTGKAIKQADLMYGGVSPKVHYVNGVAQAVPGTGTPPTAYPQARQQLILMGPKTKSWIQQATAIVNSLYAPGEGGRPLAANQPSVSKIKSMAHSGALFGTPVR